MAVAARSSRGRGRLPRAGVIRTPCPDGHEGRIQLNGFARSKSGLHERQLIRCVPFDRSIKPHRFRPKISARHDVHSHTGLCDQCERPLSRSDGPRTGQGFELAIREIAHSLIRAGQGASYREASRDLRRDIGKKSRVTAYPSTEANLALNYMDAFADLVLEADRPKQWPPIVVVDALPFRERIVEPNKKPRKVSWPASSKPRKFRRKPIRFRRKAKAKERGRIFAAMGMNSPFDQPTPLLVRFMGGGDEVCWREFFESLPGTPRWLVSDRDGGIINGAALAWRANPPVHYFSHYHLAKNARDAAAKDLVPQSHVISELIEVLMADPPNIFPQLEAEARRESADGLLIWLRDNRQTIFELEQKRQPFPHYPLSTGGVEGLIVQIKRVIKDRIHLFTNADRLDRLLALVANQISGRAIEKRYTSVLRAWFEKHNGGMGAADWGGLRDRSGTSSIRMLILDANDRAKRAKRRRHAFGNSLRYRQKRQLYVATRQAAGMAPPPVGTSRATRAAVGSVAGKTVADFGWLVAEWHPTRNGSLQPEDVLAGSGSKVWWLCDRGPDHEWEAQVRSRSIRGSGCPFCAHRLTAKSQSLAITHPDIAAQWHPTRNGNKKPEDYTFGSHFEPWWQCPDYKTHVWQARIASRTVMLSNCPSCALAAGKGARPKGKKDEPGEVVAIDRDARTARSSGQHRVS